MSRYCHPTLKAHLVAGVTTVCSLIKIVPVDPLFPTIGMTSLDVDVTYDDGTGPLLYHSAIGFFSATVATSADKEVGTSQADGLVSGPEFDIPMSEDEIERGVYDYAEYIVHLVNYNDLTSGRHAVLDFGTTGRWTLQDGVIFAGELRSLIDKLKQSIVKRDSRLCRARFGTQIGDERYPCLVNTGPLWKPFTIDTVDTNEPDRIFKALGTGVAQPDGTYRLGMVRFLTGLNAGRSYEVETNLADGTTTLRFATRWPIDPSDTGEIRIGCRKRFLEDCIGVHNNGNNFRGEPHSQPADAVVNAVPGVATQGTTNTVDTTGQDAPA